MDLEEALRNAAFKEKRHLDDKKVSALATKYGFTIPEVAYLKRNFLKMAPKAIMDLEIWKKSLGIMNVPKADHLAKQIFRSIDKDRDGFAFFEDYVAFTDILTMGSIKEKAMYSFRLLDYTNKGYIVEEDIHKMMSSVFEVWNIMTNSRVVVLPKYVREVYRQLDRDGDGQLDFEEYQQLYMRDQIVFGWYEYLNQDEFFMEKMINSSNNPAESVSPLLNKKLDQLKGEIGDAMKMLIEIENKSAMNSATPSPIMTPTRSRSVTPTKLSQVSKSQTPGTGVKSVVLHSQNPKIQSNKGPFLNEISVVGQPPGDFLPTVDPLADDEDTMESTLPNQTIDFVQSADISAETSLVKKKMTQIGSLVKNIETMEFEAPKEDFREVDNSTTQPNLPIDPNRRKEVRKNLGLFFGHENWNLIMNMMIGFRAGLKS